MLSHTVLLSLLAAAAHAADHPVAVGGPGLLAYTPSNITADVGDTITFVYHEKNHTATQSSFNSPCSPMPGGFDSGFMPVAAGTASGFPTYTITVNDTQPIWVYCRQQGPPPHCQSGMVFSANAPPTGSKTFDQFKAAAIALGGGASASDAATASSDATAFTSPPPPVVETVTATVTVGNSVYTTTYASWSGAPADPTPAAQPAVHTIVVGGMAGNVYTPPTVNAQLGDIVMFEFHGKNHTATQSTFNSPCTRETSPTEGFDSGFMPVSINATTGFPTFNITVNVTTPIWGYCRQPGPPPHCQQGMVFGINPPPSGSNTFQAFQALAMHTNVTSIPGSGSGSGAGSGGSPSTNSSSGSGSGSGTPTSSGASRAAVSVGLGVGITAIAVAALL